MGLTVDRDNYVVVVVSGGVAHVAVAPGYANVAIIDYDNLQGQEEQIRELLALGERESAETSRGEIRKLREIAFELDLVRDVISLDEILNRIQTCFDNHDAGI